MKTDSDCPITIESKGVHIFGFIVSAIFLYGVFESTNVLIAMIALNGFMILMSCLSLLMVKARITMVYQLASVGMKRALFNSILHYSSIMYILAGFYLLESSNGTQVDCGLVLLFISGIRIMYSIPLLIASRTFDTEAHEKTISLFSGV
jgi:hypothetical protein